MAQTLNVRISGVLQSHVARVVENGEYENVSEFIRDLIRKDMSRAAPRKGPAEEHGNGTGQSKTEAGF